VYLNLSCIELFITQVFIIVVYSYISYFISIGIVFLQGAEMEAENFKKILSEYELAKKIAIQGACISFFLHLTVLSY
jgi:hypothetical protein